MTDAKKLLVIIGGSGDIGRAVALEATRKGYFVCIGYKSNFKKAKKILEQIQKLNGEGLIFQLDLNIHGSLRVKLLEFTDLGKLQCLVNCVGLSIGKDYFLNQSYKEIEDIINTNLTGALFACKDFVEIITRQKQCQNASIVNFSSLVANSAGINLATYAAAKAGVAVFSKAFAKEVGPLGIRVNAVLPGKITGEMNRHETQIEEANTIPIGRYGLPNEVANLVLWLVSEEASYVTGSCIEISGGR